VLLLIYRHGCEGLGLHLGHFVGVVART
jgi:hypothetical protein